MQGFRVGQPSVRQFIEAAPAETALTSSTQDMEPMALKAEAEHAEHGRVSRNGKVAVVPEQNSFEPGTSGGRSIVHPGLQVLLQPCARLPHPFRRRSAAHRERSRLLPLPAKVRETEKRKRLRLSFPTVAP